VTLIACALALLAQDVSPLMRTALTGDLTIWRDLFEQAGSAGCKIALAYLLLECGRPDAFQTYAVPRLAIPERRAALKVLVQAAGCGAEGRAAVGEGAPSHECEFRPAGLCLTSSDPRAAMQNPVYPVHPDGETIDEFYQRINEHAPAPIRLFVFHSLTASSTKPIDESDHEYIKEINDPYGSLHFEYRIKLPERSSAPVRRNG